MDMTSSVQDTSRFRSAHDVLSAYSFYRNADARFREQLARQCSFVTIHDGQEVMQAGGLCEKILLVGHGDVRVFVEAPSTRQTNLYTVGVGTCCPINIRAAMTGRPAEASAMARGEVCAALIAADRFRELSKDMAEVTEWLLDETSGRYAEIIGLLNNLATQSIDQRLAHYLIDNSVEAGNQEVLVVATHDEVARDLGTAREVISRRLNALEKEGSISLGRGRIAVVDKIQLLDRF